MPQKYESLSRDSSESQSSELTETGICPQDDLSTSRKEQRLRRRLVSVILVISAVCVILAFRVFSLELQRHQKPASLSYFTSSESMVLFMPDEVFNPVNHSKESDDAWATMHSRFVMIDHPAEYSLPPSAAGQKPGSNVYAVSAFHQLHCLRLIRNAWFAVIENGPQILDGPVDLPGHPAYKSLAGHTTHCFDYLRQNLMCSADSTLEAFLEADGVTPRAQGSTGWGVVHKCKNFDELKAWTEKYKDPGP